MTNRLQIWKNISILLLLLPSNLCQDASRTIYGERDECSQLRMGQFKCNVVNTIDPTTQQPWDCTPENIAPITCEAVEGIICSETGNRTFTKYIPCKWTNGYRYDTALLMSIFLGTVGGDRYYLGHIGMGALKFATLGYLFIGQLVDIIFIATQNILPKDGSNYIVAYYGPAVQQVRANNLTYIFRQKDWN